MINISFYRTLLASQFVDAILNCLQVCTTHDFGKVRLIKIE